MKTKFELLGISSALAGILEKNKITQPTPVQEQAIGPVMAGRDVIAQAQTGTGKTLAFLLPILERINPQDPSVQALVITPTRELAIQITAEAKKLTRDIHILSAYGGQDVLAQARRLNGSVQLVVGTPGRLLDHIHRKAIHLDKLSMLVLDEADQMLDLGFLPDVAQILGKTPPQRQTLLFSATISTAIVALAEKYMKNPIQIRIQGKQVTLSEISQLAMDTTDRGKQGALLKMLETYRPFMSIIFCRTKHRVTALCSALQAQGYKAEELHGDLSQAKREKVLSSFRKLQIPLLVATDVAARGLDIEGVTHIFNYDMPRDAKDYIHRIGRTGRAGQKGIAVTFVSPRDRATMNTIEKAIGVNIRRLQGPADKGAQEAGRKPQSTRGVGRSPKGTEGAGRRGQSARGEWGREQSVTHQGQSAKGGAQRGQSASSRNAKGPGQRPKRTPRSRG